MPQLLDTLPSIILEIILDKVTNNEDLKNCSLAHPRLDHTLKSKKCLYLVQQILPFIVPNLALKDVLQLPHVCRHWRKATYQFDNHVPGRLTYDNEMYLKQMRILKRDPVENATRDPPWFLSFKCIAPDIRKFHREIDSFPELHIGRSAHFVIDSKMWQIRDIYVNKLREFLRRFGARFWYIKITVTKPQSIDAAEQDENNNVARVFSLFSLLPYIRTIDLDLHFDTNERARTPTLSLPTLPRLNSLRFWFYNQPSMKMFEKQVVSKYASQLQKLKIGGVAHTLARKMPSLVELHICKVLSIEVFPNLRHLDAPLLQKLTLDFVPWCVFNALTILKSTAHLPIRQLILRWDVQETIFDQTAAQPKPVVCSKGADEFKNFRFPYLHTLTLENCPQPWCAFLGCFPFLQYFNIRHTTYSSTGADEQHKNVAWCKDGAHIHKLMGRVDITNAENQILCQTTFRPFLNLRQVSVATRVESPKDKWAMYKPRTLIPATDWEKFN